ncbi:MAG: 16S rRNA (adenine(1518)-N(6)/adenine(1519)-N(6))-dimethyltransferase RsmA [Acidobacteriota bacterium]|nr:16S rRNA (adenine(1518)-N(6)/adenine(1519)-N(6))-dimethyltransferase RsmA [Acidobacteriota bacterium]
MVINLARQNKRNTARPFAKRSLGQNFLVDQNIVRKIVESLVPIEESLIIEIGPGRGALTGELASRARKFVAIELDTAFAADLKKRFETHADVKIIEEDVLEADFKALAPFALGTSDTKIVANLPYNISTAVLERLAGIPLEFSEAVLMFQKEVVSRITARPGDRNRGYTTVITEASFETELLFDVDPKSFKPVPRVRSAVVRIRPKDAPEIKNEERFRAVVSGGFRQKRKTILNNLKQVGFVADARELLAEAGVEPTLRPEVLKLEDWIRLAALTETKS